MKPYPLLACLILTIAPACSSTSPMNPTSTTNVGSFLVTITPNPLPRLTAGGQIVWNVTFQNGGSVGVRVDRSEASVLDASGAIFAERKDFWSVSAGCSVCSADLHLAVQSATTFSGLTAAVLATPSVGARFRFTTFYTDDSGIASSISTEIPIS
jgi:hypothetical protein